MIYLAKFGFGTLLENTIGEFSFIAEASSQEEAELKLARLLQGAVKNEDWFPAPCRIMLRILAELDRLPATGIAFHQRRRILSEFEVDIYPMSHLPPDSVRVLYDYNNEMFTERWYPVPFAFVDRERRLTFPIENVPPMLW